MRINLNNVTFVRKDRTLFSNPFKTIMEEKKTGYIYVDNTAGVAIMPYKMGANGKEVLVRDEYNPLHTTVMSIITGGKEKGETSRQAAKRELAEEAGIDVEERWFEELGELLPSGDQKNPDMFFIVDVTGLPMRKPETDGSIFEKKSTNMWVSITDLHRIVREPSNVDAYLLSAIVKMLEWCGLIANKSEESDLIKAKKGEQKAGHKYIRREGSEGKYKYIYTEPKGKTGKKEEAKKPKGGLLAQLTELLGQKKSGEEEEKPKKQLDFDAWPVAPNDLPEFSQGVTAAQWISNISRMVDTNVSKTISSIDDGTYELMNSPDAKFGYIDTAIGLMYDKHSKYAGTEDNWKDLNVENKKLDESAKTEVKKAMLKMSSALGIINHTTAVLNSSIGENIMSGFEIRMKSADEKEDLNAMPSFDKLSTLFKEIKKTLNIADNMVQDTKWLQGSDPKLDWLTDATFDAVDKLMKTRNRFNKNIFSMYIGQLSDRIDNLDSAYAIESSAELLENFQSFIEDGLYSTIVSKDNKTFANQWNMKQRGIYSGASRFSAYAKAKVINKIKELEDKESDVAISRLITKLGDKRAFSFLSLNAKRGNIFHMSEQAFAYVAEHGLDKFYQDTVFLAGGRKLFAIDEDFRAKERSYLSTALETLENAFTGKEIKNKKAIEDKLGKALGDITKGNGWSNNLDLGAFNSAYNTIVLLNKKTSKESKAASFTRMWSSASHGSLMSNAIESFVDAKGIDRGTYVNYHVASNRVVAINRPEVKEVLSTTINDVYDNTQSSFAPGTTLKLYRGNGENEIKSVASSWTSDFHVSEQFGSTITEAEVPSEAVLIYKNKDNAEDWSYQYEQEHVLVPGILSLEKRIASKMVEKT